MAVVPLGGGDPATWADRLAPLRLPEFHLYDREQQPHTDQRQQAIHRINARSGCCGRLMKKRCLENYLHPQAIAAAGGGQVQFGDEDCVPLIVAQLRYQAAESAIAWDALPYRAQRRLVQHAKRWLNTVAIQCMTASLLEQRDPVGEVRSWFGTIAELTQSAG